MRKFKLLIVSVVMFLMVSACHSELEPDLIRQYESADTNQYEEDYDILDRGPVYGGTLNLFTTEPDTLNPILTKNTYVADFLGFIYEGLTRLNESQQAVPALSDRWSVSSDGLIWSFHIRDGVKWHDGQPLTAYDVEFTIKAILNPRIDSIYKPLLMNIKTCAAVDSSNIKIALGKPNSFMPEMMNFPILPAHQFKQADLLSSSEQFEPVGTGPYMFTSYTKNKKISMQLNKDWWYLDAADGSTSDGMYIETIQANVFKNPDDMMGAFKSGDVDVAVVGTADSAKYSGRTDVIIKKYTSRNYEFLSFNLRNPVFADQSARKAISAAINRNELINDILPGDAEPAELPILPGSWISQPGGDTAVSAGTPEEVLLAGGWKRGSQGYYKVLGGVRRYLKVELIVNRNNNIRVRAAQKICSQLEKSGIPAEVRQMNWDEMLKILGASKYDVALLGCRIPQIPDISYLYSDGYLPVEISINNENAYNVAGYDSVQLDANIAALFSENDPGRRKEIFKELKRQAVNDLPYVGLYFLRDAVIYSKNLRGPFKPGTWNRFDDFIHWYKPVIQ